MIKAVKDKRILCLNEQLAEQLSLEFFQGNQVDSAPMSPPYRSVKAVSTGGRNAAWYVEHDLFSGVVRQYRRGGLIGKLIRSLYGWQGEEKTRSWEEFTILQYLQTKEVSVAKPIAAIYQRCGFFYRAALITERIPEVITLVEAIQQLEHDEQAQDSLAQEVASAIQAMHHALVNHADLNAFNILVRKDFKKVYLIDFDKARLESAQGKWCQANLNRLERHLVKVLQKEGLQFMQKIRTFFK